MSIWAPVVAALGTGVLGFGGIWWQQWRRDTTAASAEKAEAYHQLITHSLSFTVRARTLRDAMRTRSGLKEGLDVTLRLRRASDPMEFYDWFAQGFDPINQAWSKIQMIGSADAVDAATQIVDACADVVRVATEMGEARGKLASALSGLEWTAQQHEALENAATRVIDGSGALIRVARKDLGKEPVRPGLDVASQPDGDERRPLPSRQGESA